MPGTMFSRSRAPALAALAAVACFCVALRAATVDRFVRFREDDRLRYRASTFVFLILAFALLFVAMMPGL